ncbi:MAG: hypothetical protein D8M58_10565 [Calditrichaeota bacterium]|nr:MAG: hypothetical protein DWQ03_09940 [Calditrichota bacterium]MBL1205833.1 hypothetical protein [Calditrichota bacterium]NOG45660.1 outer membrane beta-barrel protein [Calditrichota bacterium]
MKLWKKKTFRNIGLIIFITVLNINASNLWVSGGLYDFANDVSKEFYKYGWSFRVQYDFLQLSQMNFSISTGGSFSSVPYNGEEHEMYLIPLQFSWRYNFLMEHPTIQPFFGSGIGAFAKMDLNEFFPKRHHAYTYGYHLFSGLEYKISDRVKSKFEMRYNVLIPPTLEDINSSGFDILIGVGYSF